MLNQITVGVFPDMKQSDREKVMKDLKKKAFPNNKKGKAMSNAELAKLLGAN